MAKPAFKYNPGFYDDAEIKSNFVVRLSDFDLLMDVVRSNSNSSSNRHVLVVGPRGAGKTTLVRRIVAAIKTDEHLHVKWLPIVFGEESYNITNAGEFWLEAIYHLDKQLEDPKLHNQYNLLSKETDEKKLRENALELLTNFSRQANRRLILVLENLNMLFDGQMSANEGWILRHTLQNCPEIMLLATATATFEELKKPDRGLFEQFKMHHLRALSTRDCATLWNHYCGEQLPFKKIRPIQILTGGSPRLLRILCDYAVDNSFFDLMGKLSVLVDQYTDYFKSQLEALPTKERKVFVAVLELWDPVTTKLVATAARMPVNTVSALLGRLEERGAISKSDLQTPPRWQATERLFNIFYLMRRRGAPSSRVHALVKFMTIYYEKDQLVERAAALAREACSLAPEHRVDHFIALSGLIQTIAPGKRNEVLKLIPEQIARDPLTPPELSTLWEGSTSDIIAPDVKFRDQSVIKALSGVGFMRSIATLIEKQEFGEAKDRCLNRLKQHPHEMETLLALGATYSVEGNYLGAEEAYRKALLQRNNDGTVWALLGDVLATQSRFAEAAECFETATRLKPENGEYWRKLALLLERTGERVQKVEDCLREAVRLQPNLAVSWISIGKWLWRHKKAGAEAEEALRKATEVEATSPIAWETLADFLQEKREYSAAENAILRAKDIRPTDAVLWSKFADILSRTRRKDETIRAYEKAIDLSGGKRTDILIRFAQFLNKTHDHKRADHIFQTVVEVAPKDSTSWLRYGQHLMLTRKNPDEAEAALRKAIELKPERANLYSTLGNLLAREGRLEEAEKLMLRGVELSKTNCSPLHEIGCLMIKLNRTDDAIKYLEQATTRNPNCLCAGSELAELLSNAGKVKEAEKRLRSIVAGDPKNAWAYYALARHLAQFSPEHAASEFYRALELSDGDAFIAEVFLRFILDSEPHPIETIRKVAGMLPRDPNTLNSLAWAIHAKSKQSRCSKDVLDFATSLAREAASTEPDCWPYRHTLGTLFADQKKISDAIEEIRFLSSGVTEGDLEELIELCVAVGRLEPKRLRAVLEDAHQELLEPLIVALKLVADDEVHVALEVLEVAKDIANQIKSGDADLSDRTDVKPALQKDKQNRPL